MEFILLWASFLIIMATDLQRGILIGIVLAVLYFAWSYAQASSPIPHTGTSSVHLQHFDSCTSTYYHGVAPLWSLDKPLHHARLV